MTREEIHDFFTVHPSMFVRRMIKLPPGFNWFAVLKDLCAGMNLTPQEHSKLVDYAACWTTCACGQLCANLPRNGTGAPKDPMLAELGGGFMSLIMNSEWRVALKCLHRIEARTNEILALNESTPRKLP